jgi:hypothetical protein
MAPFWMDKIILINNKMMMNLKHLEQKALTVKKLSGMVNADKPQNVNQRENGKKAFPNVIGFFNDFSHFNITENNKCETAKLCERRKEKSMKHSHLHRCIDGSRKPHKQEHENEMKRKKNSLLQQLNHGNIQLAAEFALMIAFFFFFVTRKREIYTPTH